MKQYRLIALIISALPALALACPAEIHNDTERPYTVLLDEWEEVYLVQPDQTIKFGDAEKRARFFVLAPRSKTNPNPIVLKYVKQIACGADKDAMHLKMSKIISNQLGSMFEVRPRYAPERQNVSPEDRLARREENKLKREEKLRERKKQRREA